MSGGEGRGEAVVFDHRAAPLRVTHGANICHTESVAGGGSAQILDTEDTGNIQITDQTFIIQVCF